MTTFRKSTTGDVQSYPVSVSVFRSAVPAIESSSTIHLGMKRPVRIRESVSLYRTATLPDTDAILTSLCLRAVAVTPEATKGKGLAFRPRGR